MDAWTHHTPTGLHHCYRNGALVSASGVIPTDTADHVWSAALREVGCNSIHCDACGSAVTAEAPGARGERRYACRCTSSTVYARRFLDGQPEDRPDGPVPESWGCGGHPPRALPLTLDGIEIANTPDWSDWMARSAAGLLQPVSPPAWLPPRKHVWLERLLATMSSAERQRFAEQVIVLLSKGGDVLPLALDLAQRLHLPAVRHAIVAMVAGGTFDWRADPKRTKAVVTLLEQSANDPHTDDLLPALRAVLLGTPNASGAMYALARRDASWLANNAAAVIAANPNFTDRLFTALGESAPDLVATALDQLIAARVGTRADLERVVARSLPPEDAGAWMARLEGFA